MGRIWSEGWAVLERWVEGEWWGGGDVVDWLLKLCAGVLVVVFGVVMLEGLVGD